MRDSNIPVLKEDNIPINILIATKYCVLNIFIWLVFSLFSFVKSLKVIDKTKNSSASLFGYSNCFSIKNVNINMPVTNK